MSEEKLKVMGLRGLWVRPHEINGVHVILRACLMEFEGIDRLHKTFYSPEEAAAWIEAQRGEYFKPSDYYTVVGRAGEPYNAGANTAE